MVYFNLPIFMILEFDPKTIPYWWSYGQYNRRVRSGRLGLRVIRNLVWVNGRWSLDQQRFYSELSLKRPIPRSVITNLQLKTQIKELVGVLDIETFVYNGQLIPYAVGLAYMVNGSVAVKTFYISKTGSLEVRSTDILSKVCKFINNNLMGYTIYAHNLGKFDGYLILESFIKNFGPFKLLLDKSRSIICINLPRGIIIKDSLRILPNSLKKLGEMFETKHLKLDFDHTRASIYTINDIKFKDELLTYLNNDLLCLLEVIIKSSEMMLNMFNVDIHDCYSTSSLAFRIFRTNFILQDYIPTLPIWLDHIIRKSYRGGSVDVYKVFGNEAYYYDVNSLYPYAMCKLIPYEYLGFKLKPNIDKFFGFIYAYIYVPKNVKVPLVGVKNPEGSLYYPTGHIKGIYFSEELKAFKAQGYKVCSIYGYEFSKVDLFSKYVDTLYNLKAESSGAKREFVKLLLNGLYGYFGRNPNTISATLTNDYDDLFLTHKVSDIKHFTNTTLILHETLPDKELCNSNNVSYKKTLNHTLFKFPLKTNVAIASAITSYARIHMMQFKTLPDNEVLYTDTDSVFLSKPLDSKFVDSILLGFMKDELKGGVITNYLFLEPKLYYYKTNQGVEVIKARGVTKNLLNYGDMVKLWKGDTIIYSTNRLYKSFINITITQKTIKSSIKLQFNRKDSVYDSGVLIRYRPKHISLFKMF